MAELALVQAPSTIPGVGDELTLAARQTDELVFAFVGPIGSGVSYTAALISKKMTDVFGYDCQTLKVSEIIEADAIKVSKAPDKSTAIRRVETLQQIGGELRSKFGTNYLAMRAIERINDNRAKDATDPEEGKKRRAHAEPRRYVTLIDSLKRPEEIALLRRVYGDLLHVFCVFAPEEIRRRRLKSGRHKTSELDKIFEIDEDEGSSSGQRVRDTAHVADFFIRNDGENDVLLSNAIDRFLQIIFGIVVHTPTVDETAMYSAMAAARGSACLSRQVGAVIYNEEGEQIGRGCNDVPKAGGGLYGAEDEISDHRCYRWGAKICHNDSQKTGRFDEIVRALVEAGHVEEANANAALKVVSSTRIKDLIEFSRAVHAEMEAIISVARNGNTGLVGSTLYCTTFPCHSCARHIVASGIRRVVYIEPYVKSLAGVLHEDAITFSQDGGDAVLFQQYQGVAPRNVDGLFGVRGERKRDGKLLEISPREARPVCVGPLDGIAIRETLVIRQSSGSELKAEEGSNDQANGNIASA